MRLKTNISGKATLLPPTTQSEVGKEICKTASHKVVYQLIFSAAVNFYVSDFHAAFLLTFFLKLNCCKVGRNRSAEKYGGVSFFF